MLNVRYVLMLLLLLNVSCGHESPRRVSAVNNTGGAVDSSRSEGSTPVSSRARDRSIRDVNFHNFTYQWYPKWEYMLSERKEFTLREGKTEIAIPSGSNEPSAFELVNIQYGDVTGDGAEEAVVTIRIDVMGNSMPYVVFVYTLTDGEPKMLWVHETGDRADEGLRNVYVTGDHLLAVEQYNADKLESSGGEATAVGLCCPKTFIRTFYKWRKSQFQKFREETHPNNYKDARVMIGGNTGE